MYNQRAVTNLSPQARKAAVRGARIGAVCTGGAAFGTGLLICILHQIPIPPLAVTEFGVLLGGLAGAGIGILCTSTRGRYSLYGVLLGLLLGLATGLALGSDLWAVLRFALLGVLIGWRLALNKARARLETPAWTSVR